MKEFLRCLGLFRCLPRSERSERWRASLRLFVRSIYKAIRRERCLVDLATVRLRLRSWRELTKRLTGRVRRQGYVSWICALRWGLVGGLSNGDQARPPQTEPTGEPRVQINQKKGRLQTMYNACTYVCLWYVEGQMTDVAMYDEMSNE